ncbi:MAG: hypothetical protein V9G15_06070 [Dermatophilaceae bacterium]|nr:hypothetical protein [Actinomycetales bacterium]
MPVPGACRATAYPAADPRHTPPLGSGERLGDALLTPCWRLTRDRSRGL